MEERQFEMEEKKEKQFNEEELQKAFEDYLLNGEIKREYFIGEGKDRIRVVFRTLTLKELDEIMQIYSSPDILNKPLYAIQIPTLKALLARAIESYDNRKLKEEDFDKFPIQLIEQLRQYYMDFDLFCRAVFSQKKS